MCRLTFCCVGDCFPCVSVLVVAVLVFDLTMAEGRKRFAHCFYVETYGARLSCMPSGTVRAGCL